MTVDFFDLDAIRAALSSAYHHQLSYDTMESYRRLDAIVKPSEMTQALGRALVTAEHYLTSATGEGEVNVDQV